MKQIPMDRLQEHLITRFSPNNMVHGISLLRLGEVISMNTEGTTVKGIVKERGLNHVSVIINDDFILSSCSCDRKKCAHQADYVYILDPWWNPAVEAQAIDRTHRIGQDKHIFAYKLICKDSIEEKILELQNKKKKLASDIIRTDENVLKSLDKEELMQLFT